MIVLLHYLFSHTKEEDTRIILHIILDVNNIATKFKTGLTKALPGYHALTGCDNTGTFMRRSKVRPLKILQKMKKYQTVFATLWNFLVVTEQVHSDMEVLVCADIKKRKKNIDSVRYENCSLSAFSIKLNE